MPPKARPEWFSDETWAEALKHRGLVAVIARRFVGHGLDHDDLFQEGLVAVCRAVERFDADRGTAFSSFASRCIATALRDATQWQGATIRVPRFAARLAARTMRGQARIEDMKPRRAEIARDAIRALGLVGSLGDDRRDFEPTAPDDREGDEVGELLPRVLEAIGSLDERDRTILRARYPLDGSRRRSLEDVGRELGITKERTRQIEARALARVAGAVA